MALWLILALALGQDPRPTEVRQDESTPDVTPARQEPPPSFEQEMSLDEILATLERLTVEFPDLFSIFQIPDANALVRAGPSQVAAVGTDGQVREYQPPEIDRRQFAKSAHC